MRDNNEKVLIGIAGLSRNSRGTVITYLQDEYPSVETLIVRFNHEAEVVRELGGVVLHVKKVRGTPGLYVRYGDVVITRSDSLDELYAKLNDVILIAMMES